MSQGRLFCSNCNAVLTNIYDSQDYNTPPLEISDSEKQVLKERHDYLNEILQHLNETKKNRLMNQLDTNADLQIYVCFQCHRLYDTLQLQQQDITHSDSNNILPYKGVNKHLVVSDDLESVEKATRLENDQLTKQEIFISQATADKHRKREGLYRSKFGEQKRLYSVGNVEYAAKDVKQIVERYGSKNVKVDVKTL